MSKPNKIRVDFKRNRVSKTRRTDITRDFHRETFSEDETFREERISGKGTIARQRTVVVQEGELVVGQECRSGIVLGGGGIHTFVEDTETGVVYRCAVRRLLKTLHTEERHVVVAGDFVQFRPEESTCGDVPEGMIERVEPRYGCLCRTSKKRKHTLAANIDQLLMVTSLAEPEIKLNLVDRMLLTADQMKIPAILCINKIDLGDPTWLVPTIGNYARMGYEVILTSTRTGFGIERLRRRVCRAEIRSVVAGQSGVGKSSLLNVLEEGLDLKTREVSDVTQKGKHTTTSARLIKLACGGYVVDTPGIRSFELWDVIPEEVAGLFRDIAPLVSLCHFQDCTHRHEEDCAVQEAVELGQLQARRYDSYRQILESAHSVR
ncbi:MAG: ribosome small subunit-dependent GTPase A [Planctomycetia bacterium]|nr:ribosome small subunit-dependent GTPase A [Planctomycetia bacterium]